MSWNTIGTDNSPDDLVNAKTLTDFYKFSSDMLTEGEIPVVSEIYVATRDFNKDDDEPLLSNQQI